MIKYLRNKGGVTETMARAYLARSWIDPRQKFRTSPIHGIGSFARAPIRQGEVVEIVGGEQPGLVKTPRAKGGGIFVQESLLEGHSFFKVSHSSVWSLCTDAVRDFILEKQYTNIDFLEVGELF